MLMHCIVFVSACRRKSTCVRLCTSVRVRDLRTPAHSQHFEIVRYDTRATSWLRSCEVITTVSRVFVWQPMNITFDCKTRVCSSSAPMPRLAMGWARLVLLWLPHGMQWNVTLNAHSGWIFRGARDECVYIYYCSHVHVLAAVTF